MAGYKLSTNALQSDLPLPRLNAPPKHICMLSATSGCERYKCRVLSPKQVTRWENFVCWVLFQVSRAKHTWNVGSWGYLLGRL
jgi:hypothetical protein